MGGSYKGYPRPAPVKCEFNSRTVHQIWLVNSTEECWPEKPVDTVRFRDEPPEWESGRAWSKPGHSMVQQAQAGFEGKEIESSNLAPLTL